MSIFSKKNIKVAAFAALIILPALGVFFWGNLSWVQIGRAHV
jgi:hypothetical protein